MKLSTAQKVMLATWFRPSKVWPMLKTAKRVSVAGDNRRYGFADGSIIESVKGKCRLVKA